VEEGRKLAARIPNATMTLLEGGALLPYLDMERSLAAIFDLLGVTPSSRSEGRERSLLDERELSGVTEAGGQAAISGPQSAGLRIILFTDLEGHTPMMQRLGDQRGRQVLRAHERLTRAALREHGGHEVKTIGDGFMASFASAQRALNCALALQRSFAAYNADPESAEPLRVRVGINAGEPIAEDGDLFGNAVIAASRIASLCHGGEILVANVVRELTAGKGFLFADRGDYALRGFEDPMRIWELRWL
jgi:class 3 adenylate cyclase